MFSPTQSFTRLMLHRPGRTRLPPSQPHAAARVPAPTATPSFRNLRRSSSDNVASIMARKAAPVSAGEHRERAQPDHARVRELLERVVFALRRMLPTEVEVVLRHFDRAPNVPRPEQQGAPLAAPHQVSEIQETEG